MGVVLGVYLSRSGYSSFRIGVVVAVGLAGSALATASVGLSADRLGRKRFLIALSLLSTLGGLALYVSLYFPILIVLVFLGMLNGTGTERSAIFALEQAMIPGLSSDVRRTWNLAFYNVLIDSGGSIGALGAGFPLILYHHFGFSLVRAYQFLFLGYSALYVLVAGLYLLLSPTVEVSPVPGSPSVVVSIETKRTMAAL